MAFHQRAFVADLHADPLLWGRDLAKRSSRGQADLPRLIEGGTDLQVFGVVTKVPEAVGYATHGNDNDSLPMLFLGSWRHPRSWFSPRGRALVQANELIRLARNSSLTLVLNRADLAADGIKGLLALEGMQALEGEVATLDELHAKGFRMMGLVHLYDNDIAGSSFGIEKYGLTEFGRQLIPKMEALGITIDLAHASPPALTQTLGLATKPVVVSHGGVNATCPGPRNLTNPQLRGIARNGGVVGIGYWKLAVCDTSVNGIVAAIMHVIDVAGVDHVGLGSDFDGAVATSFDASGLPMLTEALFAAGLSESDISKILGANVRRVLNANLPE